MSDEPDRQTRRQVGIYFVSSRTWQSRALFRKPEPARIVVEQFIECRDRGFYKLHAFVVMPDHFHALLTPAQDTSLEKVMQMIKGGSSHKIKEALLYKFPVWQVGFHDRWIRNAEEYRARRHYLNCNPVEARLVGRPEDCELSSATGRYVMDASEFD